MQDTESYGRMSELLWPELAVVFRVHAGETAITRIDIEPAGGEVSVPGPESGPILREACAQIASYLAGRLRDFDLPLAPAGTDFQKSVWKILQAIPYGEIRTYAEIAREIGNPTATRAVGAANGSNPIPLVIPCHRVVRTGGALGGYGGGLPVKRALLALEQAHAALFA